MFGGAHATPTVATLCGEGPPNVVGTADRPVAGEPVAGERDEPEAGAEAPVPHPASASMTAVTAIATRDQ